MTDEQIQNYLRPRNNWGALIATVLAVAGAVWGASQWLGSRADRSTVDAKVDKVQNDMFQIRLDQETIKGEAKATNIQMIEGFKTVNVKLDELTRQQRRR